MTPEEALALVDVIIKPSYLNSIQELVLHHCWLGRTYQEISAISGYDPDYVRVIGSKLWQTLSTSLDEKVTKHNFRAVLREQMRKPEFSVLIEQSQAQEPQPLQPNPHNYSFSPFRQGSTSKQKRGLSFPGDPLPLNSPLYIERPAVEANAYEAILKPGMLLRIKAPQKMGKTSLMIRVLSHAASQQMATVRLNLRQADGEILTSLDRFLRWFCSNVIQQLQLDVDLDKCWNDSLGSKISATIFLQNYVLNLLNVPLVIALDEVDYLFEQKSLASDFLPLLRLWHEESNNLDIWQNLRLIVVHCTEKYPLLDLNHSPFNVGVPIELAELESTHCLELATRYGSFLATDVDLEGAFSKIHGLIGGHPYLLNMAFYHLAKGSVSLETLLQDAPTQMGIYKEHLRTHLVTVQQTPGLAEALTTIVRANGPVHVNVLIAYRLYSLGLIRFVGNDVCPRCELYRQYFRYQLN